MTPLKFRAYFKGEPVLDERPCMIQNVQFLYDGYNGLLTEEDDPRHILAGTDSFGSLIHDPNFVLMQSTGLKDKKGVEIFEGDVCLLEGRRTIVVWRERSACFSFQWETDDHHFYCADYNVLAEVIGNIYESSQLFSQS